MKRARSGTLSLRGRNRGGIILLSVTWCVLILSLLLAVQLSRIESGFESQRMSREAMRLRFAANGALHQILAGMSEELQGGEDKYDAYSDPWGWERLRELHGKEFESDYPQITFHVR